MGHELELTNEEIDELESSLPAAQRKLITTSADFSVATLVTMLREGALVVPKFQRDYIWSDKKASRLIESLILQCPIPVIYLNRRIDEVLEVVDGNQRVTALRRFSDGAFSLSGLTTFPELVDSKFDSLDQQYQRQIKNRTIRCVIIEPESNPQIKFDVFERLNSGSTPLSPQELRHGLSYGSFVKAITEISKETRFVHLTGLKSDSRRKKDELVLRFLAFHENLEGYAKPLSSFLNEYLSANKSQSVDWIDEHANRFRRMLDGVIQLLGADAFRFRGGMGEAKKFNTAFFDAVSVGFSRSHLHAVANLAPLANEVTARFEELSNDPEFRQHIVRATSDPNAIRTRIFAARDAFNEFAR
jgi:hypothetical protein